MDKLESINPGTGKFLGSVPVTQAPEVSRVVERVRAGLARWQGFTVHERGVRVLKARDLIRQDIDELAKLISHENGKPIIEAISHDLLPAMDLMTYFAKKTEGLLRKEHLRLGKWAFMGHQSYLEFEPWGVVGVISPWNFPFSIPMGGVVMALMVGNGVVLKPSEYTPLVGQRLVELLWNAGIPEDVLQAIHGDGRVGAALIDGGVNKIVFTGSVPTGKKIMAQAANRLIPTTLELGGKDPMIVTPDADLDMASSATVWGAFCNSGQVCASIERVYVHESIAKPFIDLVVKKTRKLRQGRGDTDVDIGAMTAEMQINKVEQQVAEAVERGAVILTGGERNRECGAGNFYKPTVLTGVDHSFSIVRDESFGPVLPIMTYQHEAEAIEKANDSLYALNAYIWTGNIGRAKGMASKIVAGTVNINESVFSYALPQTPWGGPKESGIGRTHGALGLLDMVNVRHVHVNRLASKRNNFWWYGYSADKLQMIKSLCEVLFGRGIKRVAHVLHFLKLSRRVKTL